MKKVLCTILPILAIALVLSATSALAQSDENVDYFVTYYANNVTAAPDATVRIVNDGENGDLWASIYVFDDSQELTECCSCFVSADGLLSESVRNQLTANPLTGIHATRGVIKVISSSVNAGGPKNDYPTSNFTNTPVPGLRGWATHIQSVANRNPSGPAPYSQTETDLADSTLTAGEETMLEQLCLFDFRLSGRPCRCTFEDFDF
jgi:hypothetical protein